MGIFHYVEAVEDNAIFGERTIQTRLVDPVFVGPRNRFDLDEGVEGFAPGDVVRAGEHVLRRKFMDVVLEGDKLFKCGHFAGSEGKKKSRNLRSKRDKLPDSEMCAVGVGATCHMQMKRTDTYVMGCGVTGIILSVDLPVSSFLQTCLSLNALVDVDFNYIPTLHEINITKTNSLCSTRCITR